MIVRANLLFFAVLLPLPAGVSAQHCGFEIQVDAGAYDRQDSVVTVRVPPSGPFGGDIPSTVWLQVDAAEPLVAQYTPSPGTDCWGELVFVLPELRAGQRRTYRVVSRPQSPAAGFHWRKDVPGQTDLLLGDRSVLRYVHHKYDATDEQSIEATKKPYHHMFNPAGTRILTKGPGGLYSHHRGIFYGFNRILYDNLRADCWHCVDGAYQVHAAITGSQAGLVFGSHQLQIRWYGRDDQLLLDETRQLIAYNISGGQLIEFHSRLQAARDGILLEGDPQHAGVQFRAAQDVAELTKEQTYYLRPDGRDRPGSFRNWSDNANETVANQAHVNLPWNAMSFVVDQSRYTCCYLDHPDNPKPARYSERDYGRFGSYFPFFLARRGDSVEAKYRFWLLEGETSAGAVQLRSDDFNHPVQATVRAVTYCRSATPNVCGLRCAIQRWRDRAP